MTEFSMSGLETKIESMICRTPVWLKTAFAVLVQEGGVLVHGWCAEKENRGKGGSGKGKIGAEVGSCRSMDPVEISSGSRRDQSGTNFSIFGHRFWPVGIQSGSSRDPVGIQSGSSRDPVGIQSGSSRAPMSGGS